MELTYVLIVSLVAYVFGAITKVFVSQIPNRFIPIQNVLVGILSAFICFYTKLETNLLQSIVLCLMATMSAGGIADLIQLKENQKTNPPPTAL